MIKINDDTVCCYSLLCTRYTWLIYRLEIVDGKKHCITQWYTCMAWADYYWFFCCVLFCIWIRASIANEHICTEWDSTYYDMSLSVHRLTGKDVIYWNMCEEPISMEYINLDHLNRGQAHANRLKMSFERDNYMILNNVLANWDDTNTSAVASLAHPYHTNDDRVYLRCGALFGVALARREHRHTRYTTCAVWMRRKAESETNRRARTSNRT